MAQKHDAVETKRMLDETLDGLAAKGFELDVRSHIVLARKSLNDVLGVQIILPLSSEFDLPDGTTVRLPRWQVSHASFRLATFGKTGKPLLDWVRKVRWGPKFVQNLDKVICLVEDRIAEKSKSPRCPHCGHLTEERTVKVGENCGAKFFGCVDYPRCRGRIASWLKVTDPKEGKLYENVKCRRCGKAMILRVVKKEGPRKGKKFFGCSGYPGCSGIREELEAFAANLMDAESEGEEDKDPWSTSPG